MILHHMVQGTRETTLHDFVVSVDGMDITVSAGSYWRGGAELVSIEAPTTITLEPPDEETTLEIWLCADGEFELHRQTDVDFPVGVEPLDRIAWLKVPTGSESLDEVELHAVRMVEE